MIKHADRHASCLAVCILDVAVRLLRSVPALVHTAPRTPTAAKKPELAKGIGEGLKIMTLDVDAGLGGLGGLPTP